MAECKHAKRRVRRRERAACHVGRLALPITCRANMAHWTTPVFWACSSKTARNDVDQRQSRLWQSLASCLVVVVCRPPTSRRLFSTSFNDAKVAGVRSAAADADAVCFTAASVGYELRLFTAITPACRVDPDKQSMCDPLPSRLRCLSLMLNSLLRSWANFVAGHWYTVLSRRVWKQPVLRPFWRKQAWIRPMPSRIGRYLTCLLSPSC